MVVGTWILCKTSSILTLNGIQISHPQPYIAYLFFFGFSHLLFYLSRLMLFHHFSMHELLDCQAKLGTEQTGSKKPVPVPFPDAFPGPSPSSPEAEFRDDAISVITSKVQWVDTISVITSTVQWEEQWVEKAQIQRQTFKFASRLASSICRTSCFLLVSLNKVKGRFEKQK